jgi:crotonobetainyl-CoA:carnitine CoA-transferase CaiB-like acyl-CoA transferase
MMPTVDHPVAGAVTTIGAPVKFSQTYACIKAAAPTLGQHSREILEELNYSSLEIEQLIQDKIILG